MGRGKARKSFEEMNVPMPVVEEKEAAFIGHLMRPFYALMNERVKAILQVCCEMIPDKCEHCGKPIKLALPKRPDETPDEPKESKP